MPTPADPIPTVSLDRRTLVFDLARNTQVTWIDGVVVLPIGSVVQLANPNVDAEVLGVRLLPGTSKIAATVCLDVRVPGSYWGEGDEEGVPPARSDPRLN